MKLYKILIALAVDILSLSSIFLSNKYLPLIGGITKELVTFKSSSTVLFQSSKLVNNIVILLTCPTKKVGLHYNNLLKSIWLSMHTYNQT